MKRQCQAELQGVAISRTHVLLCYLMKIIYKVESTMHHSILSYALMPYIIFYVSVS